MPQTDVFLYKESDGEVPVLDWMRTLRRRDAAGYAACLARVKLLAAAGGVGYRVNHGRVTARFSARSCRVNVDPPPNSEKTRPTSRDQNAVQIAPNAIPPA